MNGRPASGRSGADLAGCAPRFDQEQPSIDLARRIFHRRDEAFAAADRRLDRQRPGLDRRSS